MESEDELHRPPAPLSYKPTGLQLSVPAAAVSGTLALLQRAGRRESAVFWYGTRDAAGNGIVRYAVAPRQRMTWGNYWVSPEALAEVVHRLPDDWRPLAQTHSHPGIRVEHSNYDDRMMSSRRALSLVFPAYGRPRRSFPHGVGVHEWQSDYWHLLDEADARRRVVVTEGNVKIEDFR
jgi:hypothetical protein